MSTMTSRPVIQDLVKTAMANGNDRARIAAEGARQIHGAAPSTKTASANQPQTISTDYAMKLASAIEYATPEIVKAAAATGPGKGPGASTVTETDNTGTPVQPNSQGKGVHQPPMNPPMSGTKMENDLNHTPGGSGTQTTAMSGGQGKTASAEDLAAKNLEVLNKLASYPGGVVTGLGAGFGARKAELAGDDVGEGALRGGVGAAAGAMLGGSAARHVAPGVYPAELAGSALGAMGGYQLATVKHNHKPEHDKKSDKKEKSAGEMSLVDYLSGTKVAEDAINPAHISAGAAVPPETSASGESGGAPVGGMPKGPTGLVGSNESAANYDKGQSHGQRRSELAAYFSEPALSGAHDKTLQQSFAHTGEAGTKLSSAASETVKTAAARALLMKLTETPAG